MTRATICALAFGLAAHAASAAPKSAEPASILPGGNSKDPISIEADHRDYFEKENRAIYTGRVVVVQGDSKLNCSKLTIYIEKPQPAAAPKEPAGAPTAPKEAAATPSGDAAPARGPSSSVKHMDCAGPVTVASKTQTATGDSGSYDKDRNNVILSGHVVLSDGRNVTKGDKLIYDLATGKAEVQAASQGASSRVTGLFLPGSSDPTGAQNGQKKK
jgi:lipopolysaccharide export system protein LptA